MKVEVWLINDARIPGLVLPEGMVPMDITTVSGEIFQGTPILNPAEPSCFIFTSGTTGEKNKTCNFFFFWGGGGGRGIKIYLSGNLIGNFQPTCNTKKVFNFPSSVADKTVGFSIHTDSLRDHKRSTSCGGGGHYNPCNEPPYINSSKKVLQFKFDLLYITLFSVFSNKIGIIRKLV